MINALIRQPALLLSIKKQIFPEGKALLIVEEPFEAYQKIVNHFRPFTPSMKMISDSSIVGRNSYYAECLYR